MPGCGCSTLDKLQPRVVSFEEQVTTLREHLASLLEGEEDWSTAAQTLAGIDLDSGMIVVSLLYRLPELMIVTRAWPCCFLCIPPELLTSLTATDVPSAAILSHLPC